MADPSPPDRVRVRPVSPIRLPDPRPRHLSAPLDSFVGREHEIAAVAALVRRPGLRLATLTGPGGVGKTRLARHVAGTLADDFPDGVWFVELAPVRDPGLVAAAIGATLGAWGGAGHPGEHDLAALLRDRRALLVLDNLEHLLDAAPGIASLLRACPDLTVLATSRVRLKLSGEHVLPVPPLAVPVLQHAHWRSGDIGAVVGAAAVRLFADRAAAVDARFRVTPENADAVAAICRRLDGLPLAIELAAAHSVSFSAKELLRRLERRLPLLAGGRRDLPVRQRTVRDTIAWSYDLLAPDDQALFRRLTVFAGGVSLEAAEHAAGGDLAATARRLGALVDASMVRREPGPGGESRYVILETPREYGLERLQDAGETRDAQASHADYWCGWTEHLDPNRVNPGDTVDGRLMRVEVEHTNLRAALTFLVEAGDAERALHLAGELAVYWHLRGHLGEGAGWLEWALRHTAAAPTAARSRALAGLGLVVWSRGDFGRAAALAEDALAIAEPLGHTELTALSLHLIGIAEEQEGNLDRAEPLMERALGLWRAVGLVSDEAWAIQVLSEIAHRRGDAAASTRRSARALALFRELDHPAGIAGSLSLQARLAHGRGDEAEAAWLYHAVLRSWLSVDMRWLDAIEPSGQAEPGRFPRWAGAVDRRSILRSLVGLAEIAVAHGAYGQAATLTGAFEALNADGGVMSDPPATAGHARTLATVRRALSGDEAAGLLAAGRSLPLETALEVALGITVPVGRPPGSAYLSDSRLTPRELDVLRLVAEGRSNAQIADALFVGVRTVRAHVSNILAKLDVPTRTAAAAHAIHHGMVGPRQG